jgi:predicted RNA-binding Zn ribbon-like protein
MIDTKEIEAFAPLKERLCLDFINTADEHLAEPVNELLTSYVRLVEWSVYLNAVSEEQAKILLSLAEQHPDRADEALHFAINVREALFRVLRAAADNRQPEPAEMQAFNGILAKAMSHLHMTTAPDNFSWTCALDENDLETMIWPVVWSAAELMTSRDLHYLRECASEDCEWLFLDTSKNHSRRWCSMKECGNRSKARTHYQRGRTSN